MGVLNEIFGPDKKTAWRQFAKETGAAYIDGHFGNSDRIEISFEKWQIVFDVYISRVMSGSASYQQAYTRVRAPFIPRDDLKFSVYRKGLLSSIGKLFGAQDIVVGDPVFDDAFIIKGNDEYKIQSLFSSDKLRKLILSQKDVHLEKISDEGFWGEKLPQGISELYFNVEDEITDVEQLKNLQLLFEELLTQLSKTGSATPCEKVDYEIK